MSLSDKLGEVERQALERYGESGWMRAAVASIPGIGTALDALAGTRGQNIAMRRCQGVIEELRAQAERLDQSKLDQEFLESEDFYDLTWAVFERGQRTSQREKVGLYVRVLLQGATGAPGREGALEYVALLADLTPLEIQLLSVLYPRWKEVSYWAAESRVNLPELISPAQLQDAFPLVPPGILAAYLKRLERTGLISEVQGMIIGYGGDVYFITEYFRQMMDFLQLTDMAEFTGCAPGDEDSDVPPRPEP